MTYLKSQKFYISQKRDFIILFGITAFHQFVYCIKPKLTYSLLLRKRINSVVRISLKMRTTLLSKLKCEIRRDTWLVGHTDSTDYIDYKALVYFIPIQ